MKKLRNRTETVSLLVDPGVVAIIRAGAEVPIGPVIEALIGGGIVALEITLTTPGALEWIREARQRIGERAVLGAGSVVDGSTCRAALDAGAEFIVTPICRTDCITVAHERNCPIMLGAYTPTEAQVAHEAGADFVKIFPAEMLGPAYMRALRAPLPHLRLVPTGGVDKENVGDYFKAGCAAVGVGSALVSAKILGQKNWQELRERAGELVAAARHGHEKPHAPGS